MSKHVPPPPQPKIQFFKVYYYDAGGAASPGSDRKVLCVKAEGGLDAVANYARKMKGLFVNPRCKALVDKDGKPDPNHAFIARAKEKGKYLELTPQGDPVDPHLGGLPRPGEIFGTRL